MLSQGRTRKKYCQAYRLGGLKPLSPGATLFETLQRRRAFARPLF